MKNILISSTRLSLEKCMSLLDNEGTGGIVNFVGTVRNQTKGLRVLQLEFEAYEKMAIAEMHKIADEALRQFEIQDIIIHHRVGTLAVKEIPVIIVVAAAHRKAAFQACEFAIDQLKESVPIWKKEYFENGTQWVAAHP